MIPPVDLVSFDAGGVLLFPDWGRVSAVLAAHGLWVSPEQLAAADARAKLEMDRPAVIGATNNAGHGSQYFTCLLAAAGLGPSPDRDRAIADVYSAHAAHNLWDVVPAGVHDVLRRLRARGFALVVVSNSDGRLQALLDDHRLAEYFALVVDSHVVGLEKPDPAIFRYALERMRTPPDCAVHVGDFCHVDVSGARAAGMVPVLLDPEGLHPGCPCARVRSLGELERLLSGPGRRGRDGAE